jgi:hypothetical protein
MSRQHLLIFGAGLAYIAVSSFLIWTDKAYFSLFPLGLMAIYAAIYHPKFTFLSLGLLAPLSINIEEWTSGFGLFVPTEPLLFGIMFLLVWMQLKNPFLDKRIWRHPIIWTVGFYVLWILVTSITSAHPVTSLKFLLANVICSAYVISNKLTPLLWHPLRTQLIISAPKSRANLRTSIPLLFCNEKYCASFL